MSLVAKPLLENNVSKEAANSMRSILEVEDGEVAANDAVGAGVGVVRFIG